MPRISFRGGVRVGDLPMNTASFWGFLPETVEAIDRSYDLFKRVMEDFREYVRARQKAKMKSAVLQIRRHVGEIDAVFSRLRAKMQVAVTRNDTAGFKMHQEEIARIKERVMDTSYELMDALFNCDEYLGSYPKLRDALHLKLESEGVNDYDDEPPPTDEEMMFDFNWWVNVAGDYTRRALEMLNEHLEYEY